MKVIVDDKIPYIRRVITSLVDEVVFLPGREITAKDVKDADALIVRTRTRCNKDLLENSKIRFIATATVGYDHIDVDYCREKGIAWENAPGCNSASVEQYMESVFILLKKKGIRLEGKTIGVIGGGNVGKRVINLAHKYGMSVLLNDLPREEVEEGEFYSLDELVSRADILTFHVPLHREGRFKTFHLADDSFFDRIKKKPIVINTSRGEVVQTESLLAAMREDKVSEVILDVWENEPQINLTLLNQAFIGTPHIAGYSADAKVNATRMALDAFCRFFRLSYDSEIVPPPPLNPDLKSNTVEDRLLEIYNPMNDNDLLKSDPSQFEYLRGHYPIRREKQAYVI